MKIKLGLLKKRNKKAWIKMIEVFISVMLLTGAVTLMINENFFTGEITKEINNNLDYMIKTIQLDDSLRGEILGASLPVYWDDFNSQGLQNTRGEIETITPVNLICQAQVCALNDACLNSNAPTDKNVYSRAGYISADLDTYSPRQLKIFCWRK
jgi:hypothetical protein